MNTTTMEATQTMKTVWPMLVSALKSTDGLFARNWTFSFNGQVSDVMFAIYDRYDSYIGSIVVTDRARPNGKNFKREGEILSRLCADINQRMAAAAAAKEAA